jgi:hypothetical protein
MRIVRYLSLIILSSFAVAQAFFLQVLNIGTMSPIHISQVHFFAGWNYFGGAIIRLPSTTLTLPQDIQAGTQTISCQQQLRWLYYNNQRWQRLYPLDSQTAQDLQLLDTTYEDLVITWWLYSWCTWTGVDTESIFWQITYNHNGTQTELFAWLEYVFASNSPQFTFRNSLQYFSGNPLWYIYDSAWWIGFIGGLFDEHEVVLWFIQADEPIKTIFIQSGDVTYWYGSPVITPDNTIGSTTWWQIAIQGIIAATTSITSSQIDTLLEEYDDSMVIATTTLTVADIINAQRRRMHQQCQWRSLAISIDDPDTILCIIHAEYSTTQQFDIDLSTSSYADKIIFIKNADLHLYGTMNAASAPLNIFIDNGNIVWHTNSAAVVHFDNKGNPIAAPGVSQWLFLRWNFLIDGLFIPTGWSFPRKTYIHGKLVSLHTPDTPTPTKQNHIAAKFWLGFETYISLQEVFAWRCNPSTNIASDGTSCSFAVDPYALAPLVVIDRHFPSLFF